MANAFILEPRPFTVTTDNSAQPGFGFANAANDYAGILWRSRPDVSSPVVIVDFGFEVPIDTVMLFGVWGNVTSANPGVRVALATTAQGPGFSGAPVQDGAGTGNYWVDPNPVALFAGAITTPQRGVSLWIAPADPRPTTARYLYLNFIGLDAGNEIHVGRLVAGSRFQPERNFSTGAAFGVRDLGTVDFSARGVLLRRRGAKLRTAGLTFSSLFRDEVDRMVKPLFERIGNTEPVALVTDPAPDPYRQAECYFGPLVGDLGTTLRRAVAFEAKANIVSIF